MQRGDDTLPFDEPVEDPRPAANPIEMETVRARAELALFGRAAPPKLGRYHIIDRIAGGGMGVVYSAYDPELDRRVALKVVHPRRTHDGEAQARLVLEARALAKLDHPNVVKVHDVVTNDGSIVIVMELVVGETLAAWADKPHTWRDAVHVYQQAARGLEAAHSVKVVHRDFKPSNAVIGTDGRVRVLDFGLARSAEATGDDARGNGAPANAGLTATGDVLGTIAYASPEQLRGEPATPASDQFSLCVSLHQAVEGVAPFAAASFEERRKNIDAGAIVHGDSARDVPAWLRAVIARGLSPRPTDRFPDMAALVHELVRPRGIRRFRTPLLVAGTLGLGVAATLMVRGANTDDECDGGRAQLATAWNPSVRAKLLKVLDAIGTPYAREVRDRAIGDLDRYASKWSASHLAACRDHRKGATSATLLDRRMTCLDERLSDLRAAESVIEQTDRNSLSNVMDVVVRVPPVERCSDLERLRLDVEPPEGELLREQVRIVRGKIARAEALARSGQSAPAREAADQAVAAAAQTPYKPVQVEAALAKSRTLIAFGELQDAAAPLTSARTAALEEAMMPAAVEAGARLVYVENMLEVSSTKLERDAAFLEPLSKLRGCADFARPLLLNNLGVAFLSAGDRARAFEYFQTARSSIRDLPKPDLELTAIDRNVAMLTADDRTRSELGASVIRQLRDALGDAHPATLEAMAGAAEYEVDPAKAYELARAATEKYREFHPTLLQSSALAEAWRAFLARELGDRRRAIADYERAIARLDETKDINLQSHHALLAGELALLRGDLRTAEHSFSQVRQSRMSSAAWWAKVEFLRAELGLGETALENREVSNAISHLEVAVADLPALTQVNEYLLQKRLLARAQLLLAKALRVRGDHARADSLEEAARAFYARGHAGYAWVFGQVSR